jgi:hypothetical protein
MRMFLKALLNVIDKSTASKELLFIRLVFINNCVEKNLNLSRSILWRPKWEEKRSSQTLNLGSRYRCVTNFRLRPDFTGERTANTHWVKDMWDVTWDRSGCSGREINLIPVLGTNRLHSLGCIMTILSWIVWLVRVNVHVNEIGIQPPRNSTFQIPAMKPCQRYY